MTTIGSSDLDVFPLVLGGNTFGWTSDETDSHAILDAFVAGGGNFVDTADSYSAFAPGNSGGESETILGTWFSARKNRDQIVLATKVSQHPDFKGLAASNIHAAADASLARLKTDYIDLYYAHRDDETTPLEESLAAFDALVKAGKVRYVAISNYSAERITEWLTIARREGYDLPVAIQPHLNLVHRKSYEPAIQDIAVENNLGVFPYFALASGFLTGKYKTKEDLANTPRERLTQGYFNDAGLAVVAELEKVAKAHDTQLATVALAWLLTRPGVVGPIASASKIGQLQALLDAPALTLTPAEVESLTVLSDKVGV